MPAHILARNPLSASGVEPLTLDELERHLLQSPSVARTLIFGLPALGVLASLLAEVPLFAELMAGCFLLATALLCRKALIRFTSRTLRLLVAARLVLILVLGGLLFCATGSAWMSMVSAVLFWLSADRLLGRRALQALARSKRQAATVVSVTRVDKGSNGYGTQAEVEALTEEADGKDAAPVDLDDRLFPPAPSAEEPRPRRRGRTRN